MYKFLRNLKTKLRQLLGEREIQIGKLFDKAVGIDTNPIYGPDGTIKFVRKGVLDGVFVKTPTGYKKVLHILETVPYEVYRLKTTNGRHLEGANTHIVMTPSGQMFLKDLQLGQQILVGTGTDTVSSVERTGVSIPMYDLELGQ